MELTDRLVPYNDRRYVLRKLLKLPLVVLGQLALHWASKYGTESALQIDGLRAFIETLQRRKVKRRVLATRIVLEYWPRGMYLYQLAQIDCYLLVHRPLSHYWTSSTAWNARNEKQVVRLDFDTFVRCLKEELQKMYLCNVHSFEHPDIPLLICRVQLFDYSNKFRADLSQADHDGAIDLAIKRQLISRSPYYIAFPMNSPNVVHSSDEDSYAQLILQSVQKILCRVEPVILRADRSIAVRSLEALQILKGPSRHSNSLGPWGSYANVSFEISPLDKTEDHESLKGKRVLVSDSSPQDDSLPEAKRLRRERVMIRFKGSSKGVINRKAYEMKRFGARIHNPDKENSDSFDGDKCQISKYSSLIPVEKVEFMVSNELAQSTKQVSIKYRFQGNDVFGGLHELCDRELISVEKVPGWLAGENGPDSGTITNGEFVRNEQKGGLL